VHQSGHERAGLRVLVELDALHERARAVADADDRDANLAVRATLAVLAAVGGSHCVLSPEPLRERLDDEVVELAFALPRAGRELVLQLRRHAQEHRAARPGRLARAAARSNGTREAGGEDADGDVVEAAAGSLTSSRGAA
jgi:hypothetical protein